VDSARSAASIDERNKAFWNELCGTQLARRIGVHDGSPASLRRFDDWYFSLYPYLGRHIPFERAAGRRVLEVGLGYGSVAQRLAEAGADYTGLDIAAGPVAMANYRLRQRGLPGRAMQGSILSAPFSDGEFDLVVAIGCFHHTGNMQRALDEAWRILKPGGEAVVMVYSAYSYRRWLLAFASTFRYWLWDKLRIGVPPIVPERERARYDAGSDGAAPETVFTSAAQLRRMTRRWRAVRITRENIGGEFVLRLVPRPLANALFGWFAGLDLYCRLGK
jgi:SAM-dependent methyltransferase